MQEDSSGCGRWWVWQSRTWDSVEPQEQLPKSKLPNSHLVERPPHHCGPQLESCTVLQASDSLLCVCTSLQQNGMRILSLVDFTKLANRVYPAKRLFQILQTIRLTTCQVCHDEILILEPLKVLNLNIVRHFGCRYYGNVLVSHVKPLPRDSSPYSKAAQSFWIHLITVMNKLQELWFVTEEAIGRPRTATERHFSFLDRQWIQLR